MGHPRADEMREHSGVVRDAAVVLGVRGERVAGAGEPSLAGEDRGDLLVGVALGEPADEGDRVLGGAAGVAAGSDRTSRRCPNRGLAAATWLGSIAITRKPPSSSRSISSPSGRSIATSTTPKRTSVPHSAPMPRSSCVNVVASTRSPSAS